MDTMTSMIVKPLFDPFLWFDFICSFLHVIGFVCSDYGLCVKISVTLNPEVAFDETVTFRAQLLPELPKPGQTLLLSV